MVRTPGIDKNGLKKGSWSEEEDNKLRAYIQKYGHSNWRQLPKFAGISRCGKSCRLRWVNYLSPGVKRGNYSVEEDQLILKLHEEFGNRWSAIAAKLPGRTDNEIKNHWHTHLRKRTKQDPKPSKKIEQTSERSQNIHDAEENEQSSVISVSNSTYQKRETEAEIAAARADAYNSDISSLSCDSRLFSGADYIAEDSRSSEESFAESFGSFWTEPFALDTSYNNLRLNWLPQVEEEFTYPFSSFLDEDMDWLHEFIQ